MRRLFYLSFTVVLYLFAEVSTPATAAKVDTIDSDSYDIEEFYERQELPSDTVAENLYGSIEEIRALYVPTRLDTGRYSVEVTRVDSNFYRICGTDIYIKTRYCYEYASYDDAILIVESNYGYTKGEIIFLE